MKLSKTMEIKASQAAAFDQDELKAYMTGYWLSDFSNFSSYIFNSVPQLNWAGFYLSDGSKLRLGPFCGKPACTEIQFGKGVCGTSYSQNKTLIVDDVDAFPGHIRCDSQSRSEIVLPVVVSGKLIGVFDIDSPVVARFSKEDQVLFEKALEILTASLSHPIPF